MRAHLVGGDADHTCRPPLLSQLPLLDLTFALPRARTRALLLLALARRRALLVAVVAGRGAGVRGRGLSLVRRRRALLRVAERGGRGVVRVLLGSLQSRAGGGPSHRVGGEAVPRGGTSLRVSVVGELAARLPARDGGTQGGTGGCGDVPQHLGSHLLPLGLPLLQKVRGGAGLEAAGGHDPCSRSCVKFN